MLFRSEPPDFGGAERVGCEDDDDGGGAGAGAGVGTSRETAPPDWVVVPALAGGSLEVVRGMA